MPDPIENSSGKFLNSDSVRRPAVPETAGDRISELSSVAGPGISVDYMFPVPSRAATSNDPQFGCIAAEWSPMQRQAIADALEFASVVCRYAGAESLIERLRSTSIVRARGDSNVPGAALGGWDSDTGRISIAPEYVGDYFQLTAVLLHEGDHAEHDRTKTTVPSERFTDEIRAHMNTARLMQSADEYLVRECSTSDSVRLVWTSQVQLLRALQELGVSNYSVLRDVVYPIDDTLTPVLDESRLIAFRPLLVETLNIARKLGHELLINDGRKPELRTLAETCRAHLERNHRFLGVAAPTIYPRLSEFDSALRGLCRADDNFRRAEGIGLEILISYRHAAQSGGNE